MSNVPLRLRIKSLLTLHLILRGLWKDTLLASIHLLKALYKNHILETRLHMLHLFQ